MYVIILLDLLLPVGAVVVGRSAAAAAHLTNQSIESSFQRLASARTLSD